jgi:hypothetical protein
MNIFVLNQLACKAYASLDVLIRYVREITAPDLGEALASLQQFQYLMYHDPRAGYTRLSMANLRPNRYPFHKDLPSM